jgi:hypothetical protein
MQAPAKYLRTTFLMTTLSLKTDERVNEFNIEQEIEPASIANLDSPGSKRFSKFSVSDYYDVDSVYYDNSPSSGNNSKHNSNDESVRQSQLSFETSSYQAPNGPLFADSPTKDPPKASRFQQFSLSRKPSSKKSSKKEYTEIDMSLASCEGILKVKMPGDMLWKTRYCILIDDNLFLKKERNVMIC